MSTSLVVSETGASRASISALITSGPGPAIPLRPGVVRRTMDGFVEILAGSRTKYPTLPCRRSGLMPLRENFGRILALCEMPIPKPKEDPYACSGCHSQTASHDHL